MEKLKEMLQTPQIDRLATHAPQTKCPHGKTRSDLAMLHSRHPASA